MIDAMELTIAVFEEARLFVENVQYPEFPHTSERRSGFVKCRSDFPLLSN